MQGLYFVIENNCYLIPENDDEPTLSIYFAMEEPELSFADEDPAATFESSRVDYIYLGVKDHMDGSSQLFNWMGPHFEYEEHYVEDGLDNYESMFLTKFKVHDIPAGFEPLFQQTDPDRFVCHSVQYWTDTQAFFNQGDHVPYMYNDFEHELIEHGLYELSQLEPVMKDRHRPRSYNPLWMMSRTHEYAQGLETNEDAISIEIYNDRSDGEEVMKVEANYFFPQRLRDEHYRSVAVTCFYNRDTTCETCGKKRDY